MGKAFGNLYTLRGIIMYRLSPYEQRAYAKAISHGIPNLIRRFNEHIFYIGIPTVSYYVFYRWLKDEHARLNRKNPADFANDQ